MAGYFCRSVYITFRAEQSYIFPSNIAIWFSIKPIAKHTCHLDKSTWRDALSGLTISIEITGSKTIFCNSPIQYSKIVLL